MRINWLGPLPPARSGIAVYARDLLPRLARLAEVRCWTAQTSWDREVEAWASVAALDGDRGFWRELNRADVTFCHLGNDAFACGEILEIARCHPSVTVLHEANLFALQRGVAEIRQGTATLRRELVALYGQGAARALDELAVGSASAEELAARYPMSAAAVTGALGVFCHLPTAAAQVRAAGWSGPLAWHRLPAPAAPTARSPGVSRMAGSLVTFGYFPPDHGLDRVLLALATYPRRRGLHLDVFGDLPDFAALAMARDRLGLQGQVTLHGFVVEGQLAAALGRAELALVLRSGLTGGDSAALLRAWSHGVPSLVLAGAPGSEVAAPAARAIRRQHLTADLHQAWDDLLDQPSCYAPLAATAARRLVSEHDPDAYLRALLDFAAECRLELDAVARRRLDARRARLLAPWPAASRPLTSPG